MKITIIPQRRDGALSVSKQGDTLTINGKVYDFSVIPEGATLEAGGTDCEFLPGAIERTGGVLYLSLIVPHGASPTHEQAFPAPLINPPDGLLELPQ